MKPSETSTPALRPPRPSPAPERWAEPARDSFLWWWVGGLGGLGLALMGWSAVVARRKRVSTAEPVASEERVPETPTERVLGSAQTLRALVSERFGEAYRARTVEEIRESLELVEAIGSDLFGRVVEVLERADRLKFAAEEATDDQGAESEVTVSLCRSAL